MAARSAARRATPRAETPPPPADDGLVERDPRRNPRPGDRLKVHGGYLLEVTAKGTTGLLVHSDPDADPRRVKPPRPRRTRK